MKRNASGKRRCAIVLGLSLLGVGAVMAEEVVVQVQELTVRSGKGSMYPPVGTARKNSKLEVIEKQADGWLKVMLDGKEGYVKDTALTPRKTDGVAGGAAAFTGNTSNVGAAAAGKGLSEDAEAYAKSKSLSTAALDRMIADRKRVEGARWVQFTQEGKVGPSKP